MERRKAIIIGAGVGGCASALLLSNAGWDVTVYEKNEWIGGRCSNFKLGAYRFDSGASMLMMLDALRKLGTLVDEDLVRALKLRKCEPNCVVYGATERPFVVSTDPEDMIRQLGGSKGYTKYMRDGKQHYEVARTVILERSYDSLLEMFELRSMWLALSKLHWKSLYRYVLECFQDAGIAKIFTFQSMYMGTSPYTARGAYTLLQYDELKHGIFYPEGGMGQIPQLFLDLAIKRGAKIHRSTPVCEILPTAESVFVKTKHGVETADVVICNVDRGWATKKLFNDTEAYNVIDGMQNGCSTISFYWGLDADLGIPSHSILMGTDYYDAFEDIFRDRSIPKDPSIYVHVPSVIDPSAAPDGGSSVIVLLPIGCETLNDSQKDTLQQHVFQTMKANGWDIESHIVEEKIVGPDEWQELYHVDKGACLGLNHSVTQMGALRPSNRHRVHPNVWFVGASSQPGGGVPPVIHSAMNVFKELARRETKTKTKTKTTTSLSYRLGLLNWISMQKLFRWIKAKAKALTGR